MKSLARKALHRLRRNDEAIEPFKPAPWLLVEDFEPVSSNTPREGSIVFVLHYVPRGGGGLADALHLGLELAKQDGLTVYFHSTSPQEFSSVVENICWTNHLIKEEQILKSIDFEPEYLCATAWPTAYEVLKIPSKRKLYFVQDYEPWFLKAGVDRWYAEQTYKLGLDMFTLGHWLPSQLQDALGVKAEAMPFPAADGFQSGKPIDQRKTVAVYMQPDKDHRGTELLLTACREIAPALKKRGLKLVLFGAAANEWINPDCECEMRGVLKEKELAELFADTRVGASASFTNVSLLPPRFLANGARVIELDLPGATMNLPGDLGDWIQFAEPRPSAIAAAILKAVDAGSAAPMEERINQYQSEHSWPAFSQQLSNWMKQE